MTTDAERIIAIYRRHAQVWSEMRRGGARERLPEAGWLERFCALPPAGAAILDLGCGCGEPIARRFVDLGFDVVGVDSSPEMIALCENALPGQIWRVADMRGLSLRRRFGGLIAWDSFFHLTHDDQRAMFPVFRAHAAPGAALMFTSGPAHGVAMGALEGEPLYHASLDGDEYCALLIEQGFRVVARAVEDPDCGGRCVWLAQLA